MRALVIGCGYVGTALCLELARAGYEVTGLSRQPKPAFAGTGIKFVSADVTVLESLEVLSTGWDWVVQCVSSGGGSVEEYRKVYHDGTRNFLAVFEKNPPKKFLYTSSTGVYGQDNGEWIDENSPAQPPNESGKVLLSAETMLGEAYREGGFPAVILRVAGIYGPGRRRLVRQFLYGEGGSDQDRGRWMNMIHRDDVVGAIITALERGNAGEIYNAVDNYPVTHREFFEWMSQQTGRAVPRDSGAGSSPKKRRATNKRISNGKLKRELQYVFRYPTYREGYADVLEECRRVETP